MLDIVDQAVEQKSKAQGVMNFIFGKRKNNRHKTSLISKALTLGEDKLKQLQIQEDSQKKIDPLALARNPKIYDRKLDEEAIKNIFKRMACIEDPDNLDIVIMSKVEQVVRYQDKYWLLHQRKQLIYLLQFIRKVCKGIIQNNIYQTFSLSVIILNSITIALASEEGGTGVGFLDAIDPYFLKIVSAEMCTKIIAFGVIWNSDSYLRDKWNVLDFFVVTTSWTNLLYPNLLGVKLEALRILKPLKMISKQKKLKVIMYALFNAAPQLYNTIFVIVFCFWIFAIAGLQMFQGLLLQRCFDITTGDQTPEMILCGSQQCSDVTNNTNHVCGKMLTNPNYNVYSFDNIFSSFMMVFLTVTLENWSVMMIYVKDVYSVYSIFFFILLVMIGGFFLVNLTLAVITIHFINQSKVTKKKNQQLLLLKSKEESQKSFKISTFKKMEYQRYYEPYQKHWSHNKFFKDFSKHQSKPWDARKGGFKRVHEELPPNTDPAYFIVEQIKEENEKTGSEMSDNYLTSESQNSSRSSSVNSSLDRKFLQYIWEMKKPSKIQEHKGWKFIKNKNKAFSLRNLVKSISVKKNLGQLSQVVEEQESSDDDDDDDLGELPDLKVSNVKISPLRLKGQNSNYPKSTIIRKRRISFAPNTKLKFKTMKQFEDGEDADHEDIERKSTFQQQQGPNLHINNEYVTDGSRLRLRRSNTQSFQRKLNSPSIIKMDTTQKRNLFQKMGRMKSLIINDEMILQKPASPMLKKDSVNFFTADDVMESDMDENIMISEKMLEIQEDQQLNFMGMAKKNISYGKRKRKQIDQELEMHEYQKEVMNFIENDFNVQDVEMDPEIPLSAYGEDDEERVESWHSFKDNASRMDFSDSSMEQKNIQEEKEKEMDAQKLNQKMPAMTNLPVHDDQTATEMKSKVKLMRQQTMQDPIEQQINDKFDKLKQEEIWQKKLSAQKEEHIQRQKILSRLPKDIYQDEDLQLKLEEEMELIKSLDVTFFKVRVKHFVKFMSSSFDDVLKTRQEDVLEIQRQQLQQEMQKLRVPIFYMQRFEQDNEFYQLRHGMFCKIGQNQNLSNYERARQINLINKFKKITQFDTMPRVPLQKGDFALQIQEYSLRQEYNWKYGITEQKKSVRPLKREQSQKRMMEGQSPRTKQKIFKRLKKKIRTVSKIEYQLVKNSFTAQLDHEDELFIEMRNQENHFDKEYLELRIKDMKDGQIRDYNYSGDSVKEIRNHATLNKIFDSLNNQDFKIWIPGYWGIVSHFFTFSITLSKKALGVHKRIYQLIESSFFSKLIIIFVLLNTLSLGMEGLEKDLSPRVNEIRDKATIWFIMIFLVELILKLFALGPLLYVKDSMNILDGFICATSVLELFYGGNEEETGGTDLSLFQNFKVLRVLRTLRILRINRLFRSMEYLFYIINVISRTIGQFIYIGMLIIIFCLIYSLLGITIYRNKFIFEYNEERTNFQNIYNAFLTIFQLMTIEDWQNILVLLMRSNVNKSLTIIFVISWIFLGNYVLLNLFLATLFDGFQGGDKNTLSMINEDKEINELREMKNIVVSRERNKQLMLYLKRQKSDSSNSEEENPEKEKQQTLVQSMRMLTHQKSQLSGKSKKNIKDAKFIEKFGEEPEIKQILNITMMAEKKAQKEKNSITFRHFNIRCTDSYFIFSKTNCIRKLCFKISCQHQQKFENIILVLIIMGSIKLGLDTYLSDESVGVMLQAYEFSQKLDTFITIIFFIEFLIKSITFGFIMDDNSYLRDSWSRLDFLIVSVSMFDFSTSTQGKTSNFEALKVLMLLRTLRPLRFISHNKNLKIVVNALLNSLSGLFNVMIIVILVWIMFSILGIFLFNEKLGYCDIPNYYLISKKVCILKGHQWKVHDHNFDNIFNGLVTLFVLSTLEGWPKIFHQFEDSAYEETGPQLEGEKLKASIFALGFIWLGSFFFMNLFVGVLFNEYNQQLKKESNQMKTITYAQQNWIDLQKLILKADPDYNSVKPPTNKFRKILYDFVTDSIFEVIVLLVIMFNVIIMAIVHEGQSAQFSKVVKFLNYLFSYFFICECILKLYALGCQVYFNEAWNRFDFTVVMTSLIDIYMEQAGNTISFLKAGPSLARALRVLRVSRLLRLVKQFQNIQSLINTIVFSFPKLMNVLILLFLTMFIYSVLGVFLFKDAGEGVILRDDFVNFNHLHESMLTLFRCSTGESWNLIMYDLMQVSDFAIPFMIVYIVFVKYVMLNLFILVLIEQFSLAFEHKNNPLQEYSRNIAIFRHVWAQYTQQFNGQKIHYTKLKAFFIRLGPELGGFRKCKTKIESSEVARHIFQMGLEQYLLTYYVVFYLYQGSGKWCLFQRCALCIFLSSIWIDKVKQGRVIG